MSTVKPSTTMGKNRWMGFATALFILFAVTPRALAIPDGFIQETIVSGLDSTVGVTFGADGRMLIWDQAGRVWMVENGEVLAKPLLDLSDEVLDWWDHGMLGFALDPDFLVNGYIYALYIVDWEYHITGGKPDPGNMDKKHDTFGRLTRYTANAADDFHSVDSASRLVLLGETHDTGIPITCGSHGVGTVAFGDDGTLLISCGDGADFTQADIGGPRSGAFSTNTAEEDGIISEKEQVGAFRSQLIDSQSGKILRLDPATGDGVPSNPYYDAAAPRAPRSRVWVYGLRNPYRMCFKPNSGSTDPADANPGVLYIGDVGWGTWEDFHVARTGGENFGWPLFEGLTPAATFPETQVANLDAPNPLYDGGECDREFFYFSELLVQDTLNTPSWPNPCSPEVQIPGEFVSMHRRCEMDWTHSGTQTRFPGYDELGNATAVDMEDAPVEGKPFRGFASVGGVWYTGDKFPADYRDAYYHADAYMGWVRTIHLDTEHHPTAVGESIIGGVPVALAVDPQGYGLYYVHYGLSGSTSKVGRLTYDCNGNGVGDDHDVADGTSSDTNGDGIPDECQDGCEGDANGDGAVDPLDAGFVLARMGCSVGTGDPDCDAADQNGDGNVDPLDSGFILARFGECR